MMTEQCCNNIVIIAEQHNNVNILDNVVYGQHNLVHPGQDNLVHPGQHNLVEAC